MIEPKSDIESAREAVKSGIYTLADLHRLSEDEIEKIERDRVGEGKLDETKDSNQK